jgi:hypothetical protein
VKLIRFLILIAVVLGVGYLLLAVQVVRTDDGYLFKHKKNIGLGDYMVEQKDDNLIDRIKREVNDVDWDRVKDKASNAWNDLSARFDKLGEEFDSESVKQDARREWRKLRETLDREYKKLEAKLKDGSISFEQFEKEMKKLGQWFEEQAEKLRN